MKYSDIFIKVANEKPGFFTRLKTWAGNKYRQGVDAANDHVRTNYTEPQAAAATDAAIDKAITRIGEYAPSVLAGAGITGIATHSISEWLNKKRKKEGEQGDALPTALLTTLGTIGGGIGGAYLYDKFFKQGSADRASLTYSKIAELMGNTNDPTPGQEWDSFRMASANPGVSFMWDDKKRQYMPTQWDATKKTNVPYTGKINQPAPLTADQRWDRKIYIRNKQMPTTTTTTGNTTTTQGNGTFRFGQYQQNTNFSNQKPVTPVQPPAPQYRQPDNKVEDVEGFR